MDKIRGPKQPDCQPVRESRLLDRIGAAVKQMCVRFSKDALCVANDASGQGHIKEGIQELTVPEFLQILEKRSVDSGSYKRPQNIEFQQVLESLQQNPDLIQAIMRMEMADGEPNIIANEEDEIVIADCFITMPEERKGLTFYEVTRIVRDMGARTLSLKYIPNFYDCNPMTDAENLWIAEEEQSIGRVYDRNGNPIGIVDGAGQIHYLGPERPFQERPRGIRMLYNRIQAKDVDGKRGWRAEVRIPKSKRKALPPGVSLN